MNKENIVVDEGRLNRLEEKLDRVVDRLDTLVRLEEKHVSIERRVEGVEGRADTHARRLAEVESDLKTRGAIGGRVERFAWVVVAAVVGAIGFIWKA
jgi:hypothetical protein